MKFTNTKLLISGSIVLLVVFIWFFSILLKTDYNATTLPKEETCPSPSSFCLSPSLKSINMENLKESFPYSIYLDSADWCNVNSIAKTVTNLDSINPEAQSLNREIISIALTQKLEERIKPTFVKYNPDSLISIIQWAEKFNQYQQFDKKNAKLYKVIYKYWINFVANQLGEYYQKEPKHKYDFKFQYVSSICQSKNLTPSVGNTNKEKIVAYVINKEYSYLFSRFWYGTSFVWKLVILLFLILTAYSYYCIFKLHFKKEKI